MRRHSRERHELSEPVATVFSTDAHRTPILAQSQAETPYPQGHTASLLAQTREGIFLPLCYTLVQNFQLEK